MAPPTGNADKQTVRVSTALVPRPLNSSKNLASDDIVTRVPLESANKLQYKTYV